MSKKMPTEQTFEFNGEQLTKDQLTSKWYTTTTQLAETKAAEAVLRDLVVKAHFPKGLEEGTQKAPLGNGWVLNVQGKVNRKIDKANIAAVTLAFNEKFPNASTGVDDLLKYEPELVTSTYRNLTAEERAIFDRMLIVTDGTPQVKIEQPKRGAPVPVAKS